MEMLDAASRSNEQGWRISSLRFLGRLPIRMK